MATIRVFRAHHKENVEHGPWRNYTETRDEDFNKALNNSMMHDLHPTPQEERIDGFDYFSPYENMSDFFFGAVDLDGINSWFGKVEVEMFLADYVVSEFEVSDGDYRCGETQIAFRIRNAKLIRTFIFDSKEI